LLSLAAIAGFGLVSVDLPTALPDGGWTSFKNGIFQGYQTMDLLAAFFFSVFVIRHLQEKKAHEHNREQHTLPIFFKAALLGAGLLSVIYFVLVMLGAMYAPQMTNIAPEDMLAFVAKASIGSWAAPVVCCAVILACLTTSIVLTSLFADFLRKEISKEKIPSSIALVTTLGIAFFTSTLEFSGIAKVLGPILEVIYPALIVLTVLSIFHKLWGWTSVRIPIAVAFALKLLAPWAAR
jgi:LIVCS family branched-chain amino acid:cation transporter